MKLLLKLLLLLAVTAYLVFTFAHIPGRGDDSVCNSVEIAIVDSVHTGFITKQEAEFILKTAGIYPTGLIMDSINGRRIEETLEKNRFIKDAVCYKTPGGRVNIIVTQRLPVMRIMADNGEDYYIDEAGKRMLAGKYLADLTIATGHIDTAYSRKHLAAFGRELRADDFWSNQIAQIHVTSDGKVELVPRVGNQIIEIGRPEHIRQKLDNLKNFYRKVMPTVGWNKYSRINLEFENQIVCTKKN